jgi:hypothetical protein
VEEPHIVLLNSERHENRSTEWKAHLPAMRMSGEDQRQSMSGQLLDPYRVMHQKNVPGCWFELQRLIPKSEARGAGNGEQAVASNDLLIQQPGAVGRGKALADALERGLAQ